MASIFETIGSWIGSVFRRVADAVKNLPLPGSGGTTTSGDNGGTGTGGTGGSGGTGSTGGSGTGGSSSSGGTGWGSLITAPVEFFQHLTDSQTWLRVGLVLLGIALVVVAVRMMMRNAEMSNRVDGLLNRVGA